MRGRLRVLAVALLIGACGGEGAERPAPSPAATAPADRTALDGFTRTMEDALDRMYAAREAFAEAEGPAASQEAAERLVDAYRSAARRLEAAAPPPSVADVGARMVARLRELASALGAVVGGRPFDTAAAQDVVVQTVDVERLAGDVYSAPA